MELIETINNRRSIRKYKDIDISNNESFRKISHIYLKKCQNMLLL